MKPAVPVALPADGSGIKFPTGTNDNGTEGNIKHKFELAQTEVTYELWKKVYDWAVKGSNTCQASGQHCYTFKEIYIGKGGRYYSPNTTEYASNGAGSDKQPVTNINWRDAIVWCNAYTEWYNATKSPTPALTVVYYKEVGLTNNDVLRLATAAATVDKATYAGAIAWDGSGTAPAGYPGTPTATGFRLPTNAEWEFAARWQGTADKGNSVSKVSDGTTYYFTKGNSASGATLPVGKSGIVLPPDKSWAYLRDEVARVAVYRQWYNGTDWVDQTPATTSTASVGGKAANALGLYDMSGNVWEWTFDIYSGSNRVYRGGSWDVGGNSLRVGDVVGGNPPALANYNFGFRVARSQP